jgi:hypothetical protein
LARLVAHSRCLEEGSWTTAQFGKSAASTTSQEVEDEDDDEDDYDIDERA